MTNANLEKMRTQSLRAAQLKMLGILEQIDTICRRHNISYWIEGGTLLGAMRHGGFIPWDDDLDISMMREDYNRFLAVAADELPPHLFLQTQKTDPSFRYLGCKVRDLNSYIADGNDDNAADYQKGLFVDVFPFDNAPARACRRLGRMARSITVATANLNARHHFTLSSLARQLYFSVKRPVMLAVWRVACRLWADGSRVAIDPHFSWCSAVHHRASIFPLQDIEFEGKLFSAPADPDDYLTVQYGNWRQLPPVEKRQIHSMLILPELIPS